VAQPMHLPILDDGLQCFFFFFFFVFFVKKRNLYLFY
jgi:hypothetical protein